MHYIISVIRTAIGLLLIQQLVHSCDRSLYLQSDNKLCDDSSCKTISTGLFQLQLAQTLCFYHSNGETTKLTFKRAYSTNFYKPWYKTCDYTLKTWYHRRCYKAGTCTSASCHSSNLDDGGNFKFGNKTPLAQQMGCYFSGAPCEGYCGYDGHARCLWVNWELQGTSENLCKTVYKLEHHSWEVMIDYLTHTGLQTFVLSPESPTLNIPIPISILSFISPSSDQFKHATTAIGLDENTLLRIPASTLNQPVADTLGDFQIPLRRRKQSRALYPTHTISCDYSTCIPTCHSPVSSLKRLILDIDPSEHYPKEDFMNLIRIKRNTLGKQVISGSLSLIAEVPQIEYLKVDRAQCEFSVAYSIGCSGCGAPSLVGIQSYSIENTGIVPFTSNCTLSQSYLSCQSSPFELQVYGSPDVCRLKLHYPKPLDSNREFLSQRASKNSSSRYLRVMYLNITYNFLGDTLAIERLTATSETNSFEEIAYLTFSSDYFKWSLGIGFGLTSIILIITRVLLLIVAFKSGKNLSEELSQPSHPPLTV